MPRPMQWFTRTSAFATLASAAQVNFILYNNLSLDNAATKGATVTRMVIDLIFKSDAVAQLNQVHWGIVLVNGDASAAGAFPDPGGDSDRAGWLVRGNDYVIQDSLSDSSQWTRVKLDLRSQRVLRSEADGLELILQAAVTGFTVQWAAFIRTLMKLP